MISYFQDYVTIGAVLGFGLFLVVLLLGVASVLRPNKPYAEKLSKLADIYVNDAFGTAHRAHASTAIIADFFHENKCFGYVMANEITNLEKIVNEGERPITAIMGGAKVSSKITIINKLMDKVDKIIIGGGMVGL